MTKDEFTREQLPPITVVGAGSWGTALALLLARNGQDVRLWAHDPSHVAKMQADRVNDRYLPGYPFPKNLSLYDDLETSLAGVEDVLIVVPSNAFSDMLKRIKPYASRHPLRIAWGTKGLDASSNCLLHDVVSEILGSQVSMAVLSGPSLAGEVVAGLPTAVTLASNDNAFSKVLIARLHSSFFRVYPSDDLAGVELCGATKNVLAIAAGMSDGMELGANARSALVTRGLAEMSRLSQAVGGQQETLLGLAGVGDLILTCGDDQSRNRRFGLALGKGVDVHSAEKAIGQAVEGLYNTEQVYQLAEKHGVEVPIIQQVFYILHENLDPRAAVQALLARVPKQP